jgi:hypothetical protein
MPETDPEEPNRSTCKIDDCDHVRKSLGLCGKHYQRRRDHGDPLFPVREREPQGEQCIADGCGSEPEEGRLDVETMPQETPSDPDLARP